MIKVKFLLVGKTTDKYLLTGIDDYNKRLNRYCNYEYQELLGFKLGKSATQDEIKRKEEGIIIRKLEKSDYLVLLDERGIEYTSTKFGVFLIGGAYGFSEAIYKRANSRLALSQMTFTHQMVRLIFTEQLYRGFTITKGEKYHH